MKFLLSMMLAAGTCYAVAQPSNSNAAQKGADVDVHDSACRPTEPCLQALGLYIAPGVPQPTQDALALDLRRTGMVTIGAPQASGALLKVEKTPEGLVAKFWSDFKAGLPAEAERSFSPASNPRWAGHALADWLAGKWFGMQSQFKSRLVFVSRMQSAGRLSYSLVVADSDGQNRHVLFKSPHPIAMPQWSPDGLQIAYVAHMPHGTNLLPKARVWVMNPFKGSNRVVADFSGANTAPAWSKDGQFLWLSLEKDGPAKLYRLPIDGSGPALRVTSASTNVLETEPTISASGELAWSTDKSGAFQIYRTHLNDPAKTSWLNSGLSEAYGPTYSPDGKWLAATGKGSKGTELVLINVQTGQRQTVANAPGLGRNSWSADGAVSVVHARSGLTCELLSVPTRASASPMRLGEGCDPSWGPALP